MVVVWIVAAATACGGGGNSFPDANNSDALLADAWSADTTPPETVIDSTIAATNNLASVPVTFHATDNAVPLEVTFVCTLDGAPVTPCESPVALAITADGPHTFTVAATDKAGNKDATPATATWTTDRTPPDTALVGMPAALDNATDAHFSFTATEAGTFECQLDGGGFQACTTPRDLTNLASGSHTFDVRAIDGVGNVDPTPATWTWTIDLTTPNTVIDSGPTGSVQTTAAVFTFSSPNAGAGATFDCARDGAALAPCGSPSTITYVGLAEGDHTFTVRVTNSAGTPDPTPATQTWNVDHTAPTVAITSGPTGVTGDSTPSFDFITGGNPATTQCRVDTNPFADCTTPFTSAALGDGAHVVEVHVTDLAGNAASATQAFTVDTTAPDTTIVAGPAATTNATTATFLFSATDASATFECSLDGAAFAACTTPKSYAGLADGAHLFEVRAIDLAGNVDPTPASYAWTVDTIGPTTTITSSPSNPDGSASAAFTYVASELPATYECKLDGGAFTACPSTGQTYPGLVDGTHSFLVRAKDAAGNTGPAASYLWTVDTTAPTVAFTGGPIDPIATNDTTPTFTFMVGGSAVSTLCKVDGGAFGACTTASSHTPGALAEGPHTIQLQVADAAGNTATTAPRPFTIDLTPPTVAFTGGPSDPIPTNDSTPQFTFVTGGAPVTTTCKVDGNPFVTCTTTASHTTGTLAEGPHTIVVQVTDAAGNSAATAPRAFTVDTLVPTLAFTPPLPPVLGNAAASTVGFTSPDPIATFECSAAAPGPFTACSSPQSYATAANTVATYAIFVRARDNAGNISAAISHAWTVDRQAPTVAFGALPAALSNLATTTIPFTSPSDATATFECAAAAAGPFTACTSPKTYATPANTVANYTIYVRAIDAAGNTGAAITYSWQVDTQAPTVAFGALPAALSNLATTTIPFTSPSDATATFECAAAAAGPFTACSSPKTYATAANTVANYTIYVRAIDTAGNTGAAITYSWQVDRQAPTVAFGALPAALSNLATTTIPFSSPSDATATFECAAAAAGPFTACTSPKSYATAANTVANYTIYVRAIDAAGNTGAAITYSWQVDTQAPTIAFGTLPAALSNLATTTIPFSSPSDATATFECAAAAAGPFSACSSPKTYATAANTVANYTIYVRAIDTAGNTGAAITYSWQVDRQAPTVAFGALPAALSNLATTTIPFTSPSDATATFECAAVAAGPFTACSSPQSYATAANAVANYTIYVRAVDTAGNTGAAINYSWQVDRQAPTVAFGALPAALSNLATTTIPFTSPSDATATFECAAAAAGPFSACSSPQSYPTAANTVANYTIYVRAIDTAGNTGAAITYSWQVDRQAPTVAFGTLPAALSNLATTTIPFSSPSDASATFECAAAAAGPFTACTSPKSYATAANTVANYTIYVRAIDTASNTSAAITYSWQVDTQAPTVAFGTLPAAVSNLATTTIPFSSPSDASATFECAAAAAGPFTACSSPKTYTTAANTVANYTIYVRAVDTAGNTGAAITYSWQVDTQAPTIAFGALPAAVSNLATTTIPFSSNDAAATFQCAAAAAGPFSACTSPQTYATAANTIANYTIFVFAKDAAGNVSNTITYSWQVDTQAPTIAFGALPALLSNAASTSVPFSSPSDATATFQCAAAAAGPFSACTSPQTYATAANTIANYTIFVFAKDAAGNVSNTITYSWQVDTQAPTIAFGTLPALLSNAASTSVPFSSPSDATATFQCAAAAAGPFSACTSPQTYATAANTIANYTIFVFAKDAAGNVSNTITYSWQVDTQAPTIAFGTLPALLSNAASTSVPFSSPSDATATFQCAAAAAGPFSACTSPQTYATAANTIANYTIFVFAKDAAGNVSNTITYSWQVDTQAPTIAFGTLPALLSNAASTSVPFSSPSDATATFQCAAAAAGPFSACTSPQTYATAANTIANYTIFVFAKDAAGNVSNTITYSWQVDTRVPTIAFGTLPAAVSNLATTTIPFSSNDAAATFQCAAAAAGPFSACTSPQTYATAANTIANYTIFVFAKDAAGNVSNTITYSWQVDTVAPTIAFGTLPALLSNAPTTTVPFSSPSDAAATFQCAALAAGPFSACTSPQSYATAANTLANYAIFVFAKDAAGNSSNTITYSWQVDTQVPDTSIVTTPPSVSALSTAAFTYSSGDPTATFECLLDTDPSFTACPTAGTSYTGLADGAHTFQVRAKDSAGNVDPLPASYSWTINTTAPGFAQVPPAGWPVNYFSFSFASVTGAASYECNATTNLPAGSWKPCTSPAAVVGATYGASNDFGVRWVDSAGKKSRAATTTWTPNEGLVLYFPFDNSPRNRSALDYPTALSGHFAQTAPTYAGGVAGGAGNFATGTIYKGAAVPLTSGVGYTISVWAAVAANDGETVWTNRANGAGCTLTVGTAVSAVASLSCFNAAGATIGTVTQTITSDKWFNLIVKYTGTGHGDGNGGAIALYLNGNAPQTIANANKVDLFPAGQIDLRTGAATAAGTILDELRVYNTTYPDQFQCEGIMFGTWDPIKATCFQPMNADFAMDATTDRNLGKSRLIPLTIAAATAGMWGQSNKFTGVVMAGGVLQASSAALPEDRSVSLWFYDQNSTGTLFSFQCPGITGCPAAGAAGISATVKSGTLTVCAATTQSGTLCTGSIGFATSKWHHLVITSDQTVSAAGGTTTGPVTTYLDNAQVGSFDFAGKGNVFASNFAPNIQFGSQGLSAWMDEFKIVEELQTPATNDEQACVFGESGLFDQVTGACVPPTPPF
jgi:hypothetical protein